MTIHVHHLTGCSPAPLAHYLKGLGILRLVAEQKDPAARGWWRDEAFHLATTLDEEALQRFFLEEYRPTPLVGPWGARSGFFPGSSESASRSALQRIEASTDDRLAPYRDAIRQVREVLAELRLDEKAEKDEDKLRLIRVLRQRLPETVVRWIDVCVVLTDDWRSFPALLGTGGNEGSGSYFSNFSQSIVSCLIDRKHDADLEGALYAGPYLGSRRGPAPGHFFPIAASPPNGSTGFWGAVEMNPWDLILCLEGVNVFVASVARRLHATDLPQAAAPFAVRSSAVGYGSAAEGEEDRGEQWFPLWERPATLAEIRSLFAEGRSKVGRRAAGRPVDFGRAVARLGVARGIIAFERYGYVERNGLSFIAVPLGRWPVRAQPHQNLIEDIADWVESLRRATAGDEGPASIARAARVCEEAILACCRDGANPQRWRDLLIALGQAEAQLLRSPRFTAEKGLRPLPDLSPEWLVAADYEHSVELRLAAAFASQHGTTADGEIDWKDSIRRHFLPLDVSGRRFALHGQALASNPEVVCVADDLETVALALVGRRLVEAGQKGLPWLSLTASRGAETSFDDIARFLAGDVDDRLILDLARPLMALDWPKFRRSAGRSRETRYGSLGFYGLVRIAYWPGPLSLRKGAEPITVPLDPSIFTLLRTGDLVRASASAIRRLSAVGLRPHLRVVAGDLALARRMAAALAFPISKSDAIGLAMRLTRPEMEESAEIEEEVPAIHHSV